MRQKSVYLFKITLLVFLTVGVPAFSFAITEDETKVVNKLLASQRRPTVLEVIQAFGGQMPEENVFFELGESESHLVGTLRDFRNDAVTKADKVSILIAQMERAFPRARWASLGRDAVFWAEMLESFYLGVGEFDRVYRLQGSGGSIKGSINGKHGDMLLALLQTNGMDDENLFQRPYVMIDNTGFSFSGSPESFTPGSQSSHLIAVAYRYFTAKGIPAKDLVHWLNFISFSDTQYSLADDSAVKRYFTDTENMLSSAKAVLPQIMGNQAMYEYSYTSEWHPTYGTLAFQEDGVVRGALSHTQPHTYRAVRFEILANIYELYREMSQPKYFKKVVAHAKDMGYDLRKHFSPTALQDMKDRQKELLESIRRQEEVRIQQEKREKRHAARDASRRAEVKALRTQFRLEAEKRQVASNWNNWMAENEAKWIAEQAGFSQNLHFDYLMMKMASDLPAISLKEHDEQKTYFSQNGNIVNKLWSEQFNNRTVFDGSLLPETKNGRVVKYILFVTALKETDKISSRDYRRLILYAFAKADIQDASFSEFGTAIDRNGILAKELVARAEVFLTSKKNEGVAQKVYNALVDRGYLPSPDCKKLLGEAS